MKLVLIVLSSLLSVGCVALAPVATVASYSQASCSNPLSPVMCAGEAVVITAAYAYGCTEREQRKHVNGCIPGRDYRVFESAK